MNNNSDRPDCENNINANIHKYVESKHIEIENNIKLMEKCNEVKKTVENLDVNMNMKYVDMYNNVLLNNNNIMKTDNLIKLLDVNTNKCIEEDTQLQKQIEEIDDIRKKINDKFVYKFHLCSDYINHYNITKGERNAVYASYNNNILALLEKNKKYNEMMNFMLEEYNNKFNEYKSKIKLEYPKNYLIQLIVNMIILQDNRNKTNIKFKDVLIDELMLQKSEIKKQTNLSEKINLNSLIMKECYNINELMEDLNEKLKKSEIGYL